MTQHAPLEALNQEGLELSVLLQALKTYASREPAVTTDALTDLCRFAHTLRVLGDEVHFEKEETVLIPTLVLHGLDFETSLLREIRAEHDRERYLFDVVWQSAASRDSVDAEGLRFVRRIADELVQAQHYLTELEAGQLHLLASRYLDASALDDLGHELSRFDGLLEHAYVGTARSLSWELVERYRPQA